VYGFAKEQNATNTQPKKKNLVGCPMIFKKFTMNQELQIPFDKWPNNIPQL
jgi:hypothetical protein